MKIPFLNIWITTTDWMTMCNMRAELCMKLEEQIERQFKTIRDYQEEIYNHKQPRDSKGRYISKSAAKFKQVHDQLRAETYNEPQPSDTFLMGNYDEIKKASQLSDMRKELDCRQFWHEVGAKTGGKSETI